MCAIYNFYLLPPIVIAHAAPHTLVIASETKQSSNLCPARMRGHIASTGSPRSLRSLAMTKSTVPSSPLWRGAAQRRGGQSGQESITTLPHTLSLVIASETKQSSKLCTRVCATLL